PRLRLDSRFKRRNSLGKPSQAVFWLPLVSEHIAEANHVGGQIPAVLGYTREIAGEFLVNVHSLPVFKFGRRPLLQLAHEYAEVVVARREVIAIFGNRWEISRKLESNVQRPAQSRLRLGCSSQAPQDESAIILGVPQFLAVAGYMG